MKLNPQKTAFLTLDLAKRITRPNLILAICCMSVLIVTMDVTIVNIALPAIQKDLHARLAGLHYFARILPKTNHCFLFPQSESAE